ncbi:MAG: acetylxylan esterase, partial [Gemmatimonadetes bacterium]|nr:acetylxylan esterase [Gemmatimonadota bacterium]
MPPSEANYDEAKVPPYALPDPLTMASGEPVADAATWTEVRRPETLQ